jgi:hypothetical protein
VTRKRTSRKSAPPIERVAPAEDAPGADVGGDAGEREKKERVLHTRVPAVLEQELKRFADNLRVPVSNLVRTLLEDAVAVADKATGRVERELRSAAAHLEDERRKLARKLPQHDPLDGVIGFQALTMNLACACARCATAIDVGEVAYLGITDAPGRRVLVCAACVPGPKRTTRKGERP